MAWHGGGGPGLRSCARIADAIDARAGDIADAEALGAGLPITQAREQAERAAERFRLAADLVTGAGSGRRTTAPAASPATC